MKLLIVTPVHNERENLGPLIETLSSQTRHPTSWVVVDDGSTDGGCDIFSALSLPFDYRLVRRVNDGGLIGGSAFTAWDFGIRSASAMGIEFDAVMKLDADVELPSDYLDRALSTLENDKTIGLVGGVLEGRRDREQVLQIAGPVKMYSQLGFAALEVIPRAPGFDIMDEFAIKNAGLNVSVLRDLHFRVRRAIGASEGRIHGRTRNGMICRWTGYWTPYFLLHAVRAGFRSPYLVGAFAAAWGYFTASAGPYPKELVILNQKWQKEKMQAAIRHPVRWSRYAYGIE